MILNTMGFGSGKHFGFDIKPSKVALPENRVKNWPNTQIEKKMHIRRPEAEKQKETKTLTQTPKKELTPEKSQNSKYFSKPPKKKKDKKNYYDYRNYSSDINTTNAFQNFFLNNAVPNLYAKRPDFLFLERPGLIDYKFNNYPGIIRRPPVLPPIVDNPKQSPNPMPANVPIQTLMPEKSKLAEKKWDQTPIVFLPVEKPKITLDLEKKITESLSPDKIAKDKTNWKTYFFILAVVAFLLFLIYIFCK